jgi:DNA-binding transcriptional LysR family regulator
VAFLEGAKRVLAEADSALEAALHAAGRGHLRVGFLPGAALELTRPILSRFEERHPQVEVHLREGRVGEPSAGLAIGEVDVAILRAQFSSDGISREVLVAEPRVLTLPADHPLADAETVSVDDLLDLPMVTVHTRDRTWHDYWLAIEERGGRRPTTIVEVATFEEQIEAIAAGHGVGITGAASSRLYSRPGLVYRQFTDLEPCAVAVGWRDDDHNPLIASFVETARAVRDSEHAVVELITRGLTV